MLARRLQPQIPASLIAVVGRPEAAEEQQEAQEEQARVVCWVRALWLLELRQQQTEAQTPPARSCHRT